MEIDKPISTKNKDIIPFFKLERAAENIPSVSILIASLYRNIGLSSETEASTNITAQKLFLALDEEKQIGDQLSNDELKLLFNSNLSIPTSKEQDKKEKFFLCLHNLYQQEWVLLVLVPKLAKVVVIVIPEHPR